MTTRRRFLRKLAIAAGLAEVTGTISLPGLTAEAKRVPRQIKAFCIDFNWVHTNGMTKFGPPGYWADASPEKHVRWYAGLGANVIQTFAVSCNGYSWYRHGFVPSQPGLKHDFLPDVVKLGHKKGMLVMGYFCVGANSKWGKDHPDFSYGTPSTPHIPFTDRYLDYLCESMQDAIKKTGIDGYMIDWVWNPSEKLRANGWIPAERKLYAQLTGRSFPGRGSPAAEETLEYERKAINRCWSRIKEIRDKTNPHCILWLSVSNMANPTIRNSPMLKQVDWLMNESPDRNLYKLGREMTGQKTRVLQNVVGWPGHNAEKFLADPQNRTLDLYGFAMPRADSLPLPINEYLSKPVDDFTNQGIFRINDRNIAALARFYRNAVHL